MGQNQRIVYHKNALSNPIPVIKKPATVDENPVTQDVGPVLVETVKRRKTRVERFSSDMKKGNIKLYYIFTDLTTITDVWKEHNYGWDAKSPPITRFGT